MRAVKAAFCYLQICAFSSSLKLVLQILLKNEHHVKQNNDNLSSNFTEIYRRELKKSQTKVANFFLYFCKNCFIRIEILQDRYLRMR